MRVPSRRELTRKRLLAQVDEQLAIFRVVEARVRKRSLELALQAVELAETVKRRLRDGEPGAPEEEDQLAARLRRALARKPRR